MKTKWFTVLLTAIMVLAVSCKGNEGPIGPAGPQGEQGEKGAKGEQGNANVKYVDWTGFDPEGIWVKHRPDFVYFNDDNLNFSAQTIKDIWAGKYVSICYVRNTAIMPVWTLPAFFANGDYPEFGSGRKMMNYVLHAKADGSNLYFEINVSSTDGTAVTGAQGNWEYRLVFISVDGGVLRGVGAAKVLRKELEQMNYEEVCARYGIEP